MAAFWDALHRFYRGTLYQAIALGLISFTQPGIWDALNSLGAGGLASPYFVNASNAITYVLMVVSCPLFAVAGNRFSLKWVLVAGTLYVPYFAALYCNSVFGTQWFLILGSVICGFSASAMWVSEAALAVGYPELENRGTYIGIWMAINKLGSIIGNAIQLALNYQDSNQGSISPKTYLVLIGLSCGGLPLALTVAPAHKLIRKDGTKPTFSTDERRVSIKDGFKGLWRACRQKHMLLLLPIFITVRWSQTYQGNFLTTYFSVRGRALAGFLQTVVGTIATLLWGWLLDSQKVFKSRRNLAVVGWLTMLAVFIPQWVLNFYMQTKMQSMHSPPALDIGDSNWSTATAAYCLFGVGSQASVVWTYWILGTYDVHVDVLAYTTGILRSAESAGFAIAFGIGASDNVSLMANLIVAFVVFWVSVPFTTYASCIVTEPSPATGEDVGHLDDIPPKTPAVREEAQRDGEDQIGRAS